MDHITSPDAYTSDNPNTNAVKVGDMIFASGLVGKDPDTGEFGANMAEQTELAFTNLDHVLRAAGSSFDHLVEVTVYLDPLAEKSAMNEVYASVIPEPYPARTAIGAELAGEAMVEITAKAVVREGE